MGLSLWDNTKLFFNIGVSIFVIQIGMLLVPGLSVFEAGVVTVVGTLIGSWLLSKIAEISADGYYTTGELFTETFGKNIGTDLLIAINAFTVIGWAVLEVMIVQSLMAAPLGISPAVVAIISSLIITALCFTDVVVAIKKAIGKYLSPLLYIVMIWLTFVAGQQVMSTDVTAIKKAVENSTGEMPFWLALDLIIALPVSWAFIISEMTRHSDSSKGAFQGSYFGYAIANIWCVLLGVVFAVTSPGALATDVVLALPFGIALAFLISVTELDNGYSNALSTIEQINTIFTSLSTKATAVAIGLIILALSLTLDFTIYQTFLLAVGSIIVPALGIILVHFKGHRGTPKQAFAVWAIGLAVYQLIVNMFPTIGATFPSIVIASGLYWLLSKFK